MAIPDSFDTYSLVRLPPDQNGKRLVTGTFVVLEWNTGTLVPINGDRIVGNTSGVEGILSYVLPTSATTGLLVCALDLSFPDSDDAPFVAAETLSLSGSATSANWCTVVSSQLRHTNANVIVSLDNPRNSLKIDRKGSAHIRYTEGEQQIDAFGLARTSSPELLAQYQFLYDKLPLEFEEATVGTGAVDYLPNESSIRLQCDTANGDLARMRSHRYHPYQAGCGQLLNMTVGIGDTGKANVVRRWGYFDANDGYFFQLDGTDLSVVRRTSTSGSPVDTVIAQADWNTNTVDSAAASTNPSDVIIDITKINIWWLDIQWLGGGNVRMGISGPDGTRITVHKFENAGSLTTAHTERGALPITAEMENTAVSASTSEMRFVCATMHVDGHMAEHAHQNGFLACADTAGYVTAPSSNADVTVLSIRPKTTFGPDAKTNRKYTILKDFTCNVTTNPVRVKLVNNGTLAGESYSTPSGSSAEVDTSGTYTASTGDVMKTWILGVGFHSIHLDQNMSELSRSLYLGADGTVLNTFTFVVSSINPGNQAEIYAAINYLDFG